MSDRSKIEWTDATWNPIRGTKGMWSCVKISEGCAHCYAERLNARRGGPEYRVGADELRLDEEVLTLPLRWKRPRRIFVCSMTDLFEERVHSRWIADIFNVMADARCEQHAFLVLTKRPERMCELLSGDLARAWDEEPRGNEPLAVAMETGGWPLPNLWLGVSAENQTRADGRVPWLLKTPAVVRFVSLEPLLGPVDLLGPGYLGNHEWEWGVPGGISWVIAGGESGGPPERALVERCHGCGKPHPKPDSLEWVRNLRDQCVAAGVPFFFKAWGGPISKSGGRLLEGREWNDWPSK